MNIKKIIIFISSIVFISSAVLNAQDYLKHSLGIDFGTTLFAMGGSTVIAIRLGRGDKRGANDAFMTALVLTFLLSVLLLIANIF